ncbi:MAG: hypothetical protein GC191_19160 [Azospirillum sp.]|nr:hypothetical protein [Azospirillum sp.]
MMRHSMLAAAATAALVTGGGAPLLRAETAQIVARSETAPVVIEQAAPRVIVEPSAPKVIVMQTTRKSVSQKIVRTESGRQVLRLSPRWVTRVVLSEDERVKAVEIGKHRLVSATVVQVEATDSQVVDLSARGADSATNVTIRTVDGGGRSHTHRYRAVVPAS